MLGPEPTTVLDGPFAETKEVLGGYVLFDAEGLDGAERTARECPIFEVGGRVEVSPVVERGLCEAANDRNNISSVTS